MNKVFGILLMCLTLAGCANSGRQIDNIAAINEIKSFNQSNDSAKLYVGRESSFVGGGESLQVLFGSDNSSLEEVTWLANNEFVALNLEPGQYTLQIKGFALGMEYYALTYDVEALAKGMYVVRCTQLEFALKVNNPNSGDCNIERLSETEMVNLNEMDLLAASKSRYVSTSKVVDSSLTMSNGEPDNEYKVYQATVRIGTIQAFKDFIENNPNSIYINSAKRNIKQLEAFQDSN